MDEALAALCVNVVAPSSTQQYEAYRSVPWMHLMHGVTLSRFSGPTLTVTRLLAAARSGGAKRHDLPRRPVVVLSRDIAISG